MVGPFGRPYADTVDDAQTWTAIGGLLAVLCAFIGLIVRMLGTTLDARLASIELRFASVDARFEMLENTFEMKFATLEDTMGAGFASLERRVDGLDRAVAAITRRLLDGQ